MEVRYAVPGDDRMAISKVYEESWKYAYRGIIPQTYLDSIPEGQWAANVDSPARRTLVCVDNDRIVGTSSICRSRSSRFDGWGEVVSLYLLPDYMGKGCGRMLLTFAVSELKKQGYANIFLWVLEENGRARRFYERFGFVQSDRRMETAIGGRTVWEVGYCFHV